MGYILVTIYSVLPCKSHTEHTKGAHNVGKTGVIPTVQMKTQKSDTE